MASLQLPNCKKKSAAHKNGFEVLVVIVDQFHHKYANILNLEAFWDLGFIFFSDEEVWLGEYYSYWSGFWIFGRLKTID